MQNTLRDLRNESKKTCAEVAQALNVTLRAIYNYELGLRQINIKQVLLLAELFDVSEREVIEAQLNSCQFSRVNNLR
jgi:transcriptional regulator with XRE-family HTH domain